MEGHRVVGSDDDIDGQGRRDGVCERENIGDLGASAAPPPSAAVAVTREEDSEVAGLRRGMVCFEGLARVSLQGAHVVCESLDACLPAGVRRVQQAVVDLFCMLALAGVAWLMWDKGSAMMEYGDVTAQLGLRLGYFVHVMSVLCGVAACVHALLILHPVAHHHSGVEGGEPQP